MINRDLIGKTAMGRKSALDVLLLARDLTDPDTPDEDVQRAHDTMAAQGKSDQEIGTFGLDAGKRQLTQDWVKKRSEVLSKYQDESQRAQALAEAESGVQTVARIFGDLANAYAGGDPGQVSVLARKLRQERADRAQKNADRTATLEIGQLDAEREDARATQTLEASRNERDAARTFTAGENEANRANARGIAQTQAETAAARRSEDQRLAREKELRVNTEAERRRVATVTDTRKTGQENDIRDAKIKRADKKAEMVRQVDSAASNVERLADYLIAEINANGTMALTGDFEDNADLATSEIASALAKLDDPTTAAMSGEVMNKQRSLFQPGFWQTEGTAIDRLKRLKESVAQRRADAFRKIDDFERSGFGEGAPTSDATGAPAPAGASSTGGGWIENPSTPDEIEQNKRWAQQQLGGQ